MQARAGPCKAAPPLRAGDPSPGRAQSPGRAPCRPRRGRPDPGAPARPSDPARTGPCRRRSDGPSARGSPVASGRLRDVPRPRLGRSDGRSDGRRPRAGATVQREAKPLSAGRIAGRPRRRDGIGVRARGAPSLSGGLSRMKRGGRSRPGTPDAGRGGRATMRPSRGESDSRGGPDDAGRLGRGGRPPRRASPARDRAGSEGCVRGPPGTAGWAGGRDAPRPPPFGDSRGPGAFCRWPAQAETNAREALVRGRRH